ncbi:hypothetical protein BSM4216_1172 [Bacillus smithii]|nr:hypothetical protein BSM4216_1172 [Bacillus smithii]
MVLESKTVIQNFANYNSIKHMDAALHELLLELLEINFSKN